MELSQWQAHCLLTTEQMSAADAAAIAAGTPGIDLMENAGAVIAREIQLRWRPRPVVVLCGPGNNGGDGFVIARLLHENGWPVEVQTAPAPEQLRGDARLAYQRWMAAAPESATGPWEEARLAGAELIVDAVFGAGLTRDVDGNARDILETAADKARRGIPLVAVDVPSGLDGNTGTCRGVELPATLTVTFFRPKPGHYLLPGATVCGELVVRDIGISKSVLTDIAPDVAVNHPDMWRQGWREPDPTDHKYTRGHVMVVAGDMPGASILAARTAARIGAGMVTVGWLPADEEAVRGAFDAHLPPSILRREFSSVDEMVQYSRDRKVQCAVLGQGFGRSLEKTNIISELLQKLTNCILDADGISAFESSPDDLFRLIGTGTVLTPHAGEFRRIADASSDSASNDKVQQTLSLAFAAGVTVVHKGYDTIIANPDGRSIINGNGSPYLATAGTGDVLAGAIAGLRAQGMAPFEASAMAVWMHAEAARAGGPGMIADDLPELIGNTLNRILT